MNRTCRPAQGKYCQFIPAPVGRSQGGVLRMPLFMDVHNLGTGVSMDDVAQAHQADLATQGEYDVSYLRYWVDEDKGQIFCLVEAPDAGAAVEVHRKAHGLVADAVYRVQEGA